MKKIYALLAGALLTVSVTVNAQTTPRVVLFEEFTGENCGPCAGVNPYMKRFSDLNAQDSFIHMAYQVPIPSAGPIFNIYKTDANARMTYYNVNFAPWGENDGRVYPVQGPTTGTNSVQNNAYYYFDTVSVSSFNVAPNSVTPRSPGFDQRRAILSPCAVNITHSYSTNYDSCYVVAIVTPTSNFNSAAAGSLKFRLALTEKELVYPTPPGTNGETTFENVVRKMYPSASGTAMADAQVTGTPDTFRYAMAIPSWVREKGQIQFIGWVQDDNTKEVLQAGASIVQPVTNLVAIIAYGDSIQPIGCTNTGTTPIFTYVGVKNTGGATINTLSVQVKVDGALNSTYPWSGSLAPGATTQINVGPISVSGGTHALQLIVGNPNGVSTYVNVYDTAKAVNFIAGSSVTSPYVQDFEDTTAFPPSGCYSEAATAGADIWYPSFVFNGAGNTTYWGGQTTTHSIFYPFYFVGSGEEGNFYLPKVDLSNASSSTITFTRACRNYGSAGQVANDELDVQASLDCGTTWTTVWSAAGATLATVAPAQVNNSTGYFPTAAADWVDNSVSLTGFQGHDNVWIRFHAVSDYGDNVWIDQINVNKVTIGINEITAVQKVSVYPTPAADNMTIAIDVVKAGDFEISLVNTLGEIVKTVSNGAMGAGNNSIDVNTSDLSAGIYNVVIKSNNEKTVKRFVVAR